MIALFDYLPVFIAVFWKSGVALGAALGMCRLLRKESADLRRLVLTTAIVALFVAAAALPALPRWTETIPPLFNLRGPAAQTVPGQSRGPAATHDMAVPQVPDARPTPAQAGFRRIDLLPWLIPLIWFAVAATLLTRFAINLWGLHRLRKASDEVTDAGLLADAARFVPHVRLWRNETTAAPVTWGVVRPVILVPAGFEQLPAECRDGVLRHEFAHIQAHDFLMRGLAEIARAVIWFQPLVWIVWRQLREEQELACDNCVLAAGGKPSAYAKLLLAWDATPGLDSRIAVGIGHRSFLERRLYALLDPNLRRDTVARAGVVSTWFLGLAAALPLAAVNLTQSPPAPPAPVRMAQPIPAGRVPIAPEPPAQIAQVQAARAPVSAQATERAAQPAPAPKPKFDVASVKPCQPGDGPGRSGRGDMGANGGINPNMPEGVGGYFRASPGRLDITCGSLLSMVYFAYVEHGNPLLNNPGNPINSAGRIQGVPRWALTARYTIHAETNDPAANEPTRIGEGRASRPGPAAALLYGAMLQGLLEDRFQLKVHRGIEEAPMYSLTVAKGGLKLTPMQGGECLPDGPPEWPSGGKPPCSWVGWDVNGPNRRLLLGGVTLGRFAGTLAELIFDRNVIDDTGISGSFVFRVEFAPDENTRCIGPAQWCNVNPNSDIPPAATIFSALEQQCGLRLEPIRGPREQIVIDQAERPAEN